MYYAHTYMSAGGWIFILFLFLLVIVGAIVWIVSRASEQLSKATPADAVSVRDILDRRLASGELTVEQYEQLRTTIASS